MGFLKFFFKKIDKTNHSDGITFSYEKENIDEEISTLSKQATVFKGNNWDKAIGCLKEVKVLMAKSKLDYPIEKWVRLPIFLQQAGRIDEALREFEWLLTDSEERVNNAFSHCLLVTKKSLIHYRRYVIYDKIRLAFKREKLMKRSVLYEGIALREYKLYQELKELSITEEKNKRLAQT